MKKFLAIIALGLVATSCATIVTGGTDDILITSNPEGAYFRTSLGQTGQTPMSISIPDDETLSVSYSIEGYEDLVAVVDTQLSWWALSSAIFGGPVGLFFDVAVDGWVHETDHLHAELLPLTPEQN